MTKRYKKYNPCKSLILAGATLLSGIFVSISPTYGANINAYKPVLEKNENLLYVEIEQNQKDNNQEIVKGAKRFIQNVADRGLSFLSNEDLSFDERKKEFRSLLVDSFDIKTIARFSIGRYWRKATREERAEYLELFQEMIIQVYSSRFDEYSGQDLKVTNARPEGTKDAIVMTRIVSENSSDVLVRWRVRFSDNEYQIVDVIIEGVSMLVTQRSDFAAVIQRGGGEVEVLLRHLRQKVKEYEASNEEERRRHNQNMIRETKATESDSSGR